jgi:hypothetical protein
MKLVSNGGATSCHACSIDSLITSDKAEVEESKSSSNNNGNKEEKKGTEKDMNSMNMRKKSWINEIKGAEEAPNNVEGKSSDSKALVSK